MDDEYINLYAQNIVNMDAMYSTHVIIAFQVFISGLLYIFTPKSNFCPPDFNIFLISL
jgi:hypothetical protein